MENESFHKTNTSMPKSLNECIVPYPTTENLYHWANRLKTLGEILCIILSILGIFDIISIANTISDMSKEAALITFLSSTIPWALYVFIAYCTFRTLAVLLEALATTVQCKVITTKVALFEANKKAEPSSQDASNTSRT